MKAKWKGIDIAESSDTVVVEGNHYFPPDSLKMEYMVPSQTTTSCPWKGVAKYYSINIDDELNTDAAWYYPSPKEDAMNIKGYVAFWRGVEVTE
jgi:uncharacterized protein (DUF427 family)